MDWGNGNAFFALAGLGAPASVADPYAWGRTRALGEAHLQEARKRAAGVAAEFMLGLPPYDWDADPGGDARPLLDVDEGGLGEARCLYDPESRKGPCATPATLAATIARNQVLWDRFEALPDHPRFAPVLAFGVTKGRQVTWGQEAPDFGEFYDWRSLITLTRMKNAQIALAARAGRGEAAVAEWLRFAALYRRMGAAPWTLLDKAYTMALIDEHMKVLQVLIARAPGAVGRDSAAILEVLTPSDPVRAFRADRMLADDLASSHGMLIAATRQNLGAYPTAAMESMAACLAEVAALASVPDPNDRICEAFRGTPVDMDAPYFVLTIVHLPFVPGGAVTNMAAYLLYGGVIEGRVVLIQDMQQHDALVRAARRAVAALAQGAQ